MQKIETPFFTIDKSILDDYFSKLSNSLKDNWNNFTIGYSFKTNSLPWLVKYLKQKGVFAEVVSHDEYSLAKYLGFKSNEIIYNGPYKKLDSFKEIINNFGIVNLDSKMELDWVKSISEENPEKLIKVGIRLNFNLEELCPGETTMGDESGRFGFCYENGNFRKAIELLNSLKNVRISGLHMHTSTKSRSVKVFQMLARKACAIKEEFGLNLEYVDLGGGYCGGMKGRPEYPDYFPIVAKELKQSFSPENTKLIVEPGISLISKCTTFTTNVFDVREIRGTKYVMTDGSRFNIDPTMIKDKYLYHIIYGDNSKREILKEQIISGFSCMEVDRLFTDIDDYELKPNDLIVYENVGGYTMSLNPLFIQYFPAVYVKDGEKLKQVREKWGPEYYCKGSNIEE